ncbi:hypothetical protein HYDPIDRAFT_32010 [Hydnomerulius pinastri MD-312]|uniref:Uncharacterized protein n=1 Tax=Hydnomerulius pinastri MD-312 TaxID=994086 RepID=A0A0C9W3K6_9AGAM|nr:hypothetical protein HYDPIDRAFT_32010 [Hydnomerulius pinastri MD-312]
MKPSGIYESPSADDSRAKTVVPDQRVIVTNLKASNVATGLRRTPAGFYVGTLGPITGVKIRIYASFELGYTLG